MRSRPEWDLNPRSNDCESQARKIAAEAET